MKYIIFFPFYMLKLILYLMFLPLIMIAMIFGYRPGARRRHVHRDEYWYIW